MSLCYDFQKWTIVSLLSVAISLIVGLVILVGEAYGQNNETANDLINKASDEALEQRALSEQKESLQALLEYCFQHADRPNPLQDLIDKGLISETFTGETCKSVKQMYDLVEIEISEYNKNQTAEFEKGMRKLNAFEQCMRNQTNTYPECRRIQDMVK